MTYLTLLVVFAAAPVASPTVTAEKLFEEGRTLLKAGKAESACPLFEKSHALEPALGTLLNLADCEEKQGRLVKAYLAFNDAVAWAQRTREAKREQAARERATALKSRLAWLVLSPPAGSPPLKVKVDQFSLELGSSAQSVPVDAGERAVVVESPGFVSQKLQVTVGAAQSLAVVLPLLQPQAVAQSDVPRAQGSPSLTPTQPPAGEVFQPAPSSGGSSGGAIATLTAGGVVMAAGVAGLVHSYSTYGRFARQQPGQPDADNPTVTRPEFDTLRWMYPASWAAVAVGTAAVLGGTVWALSGPSSPRTTATVVFVPGGAAGAVSGSF